MNGHPIYDIVLLSVAAFLYLCAAVIQYCARFSNDNWRSNRAMMAGALRNLGNCFAAIGVICIFNACETAPTAEQIQAYSNAAHTVIQGGLQDYKTIVEVTHKPTPTPPQH